MSFPERRTMGWLFIAFLLLYLLTSGGHFYASDDQQKLAVLDALFRQGSIAIEGGWVKGAEGLRYSWFPLGSSALMLPGYLLGKAATWAFPMLPDAYVVRFFVSLQNAVFSAALVAMVFGYVRWLGRSAGASLWTALALGLGTLIWPYAKTAWSEPGATALIVAGLFAVHVALSRSLAPGWLFAGGCLLAGAASVRQEMALIALGAMAYVAWTHRAEGRRLLRPLAVMAAPLAMVALVAVAYDGLRYGALFTFPNYRLPQSNLIMEEGRFGWSLKNILQYTLSPNQGLMFFAPPVLLGAWGFRRFYRDQRQVAQLWLAALVPLGAFYVYGWGLSSWAWGLRYTYIFLPFAVMPMAWALTERRRAVFGAVIALGIGVQGLGVLHDFNRLYEDEIRAHRAERLTIQRLMTTPAHAPLWLAIQATPGTLANGAELLTAPASPADSLAEYRERRRALPDFWWMLQLLSPIPRALTAGAFFALLLLLALSIGRLAYWARRPEAIETLTVPSTDPLGAPMEKT